MLLQTKSEMLTSNKTTNHHPKCRDTFGTLLRSKATFDYSKKKKLTCWNFSNEDDGNKKGEKSNKSSIKFPGGLISNTFVGGGGCLFNLAKTIVSVLHKELERGVEKLKYEKLEIMQLRIKDKSELPVGE